MGKLKLRVKLGKDGSKILKTAGTILGALAMLAPSPASGILRAVASVVTGIGNAVAEDSDGGAKITPDEAKSIGEALIEALINADVVS